MSQQQHRVRFSKADGVIISGFEAATLEGVENRSHFRGRRGDGAVDVRREARMTPGDDGDATDDGGGCVEGLENASDISERGFLRARLAASRQTFRTNAASRSRLLADASS